MSIRNVYIDDVLRETWNDDSNPRVVTFFTPEGVAQSPRNYSIEENAEADKRALDSLATVNESDLRIRAKNAQTNNATFLAISNPTAAQVATQVKALTRQVNALIKLAVNDLANTNGT